MPIFDRAAVLCEDADHTSCDFGFDLIHHLHGLDDAQRVSGSDLRAYLDERLRTRARARIICSHHRRNNFMAAGNRFSSNRRLSLGRGDTRWRHWRMCWCYIGARRLITADTDGFLAFGNLKFGNARLLDLLDEFFYLAYIHY